MKTLWAVACAVIVVAGASVLGGGCASSKSQMTEFSETKAGEGPGAMLRRLTELQKSPADQRGAPTPEQTASAAPPPGSESAKPKKANPTTSKIVDPPTKTAEKKSKKERAAKPQTAKTPSGSSEAATSKATVTSEVPPAKPSEATKKEDPPSEFITRFDEIVKTKTASRSVSSSSQVAAVAAPAPAPPQAAPPIPEPPPQKVVPPPESTPGAEKTVPPKASAGQSVPVAAPAAPPVASQAGRPSSSADAEYRIGREDVLSISVWGNQTLTMDAIVRPDGKISMPLIQDIQAEGFTASELAGRIHDKLLPYMKEPNVSVIVKQINAPKFSVIGYVNKPGTFPMRGDVTVLQALSEAGGFTPFASPRKIKLVRNAGGKQEIRRFNYYELIDKGGEGSFLLKAGDTIVVP